MWLVEFDPQVGREQAGRRPGIVVGSDYACRLPNGLVLIVPCTTSLRGLPGRRVVCAARARRGSA